MQGTKTCQNLAYWLEPLVVRQDREACVSVCVCEGVSGVWCVCRCVWRYCEQRGGWKGAKYIVKEMISIEIFRLYTTYYSRSNASCYINCDDDQELYFIILQYDIIVLFYRTMISDYDIIVKTMISLGTKVPDGGAALTEATGTGRSRARAQRLLTHQSC
jgi:hypothetical protein